MKPAPFAYLRAESRAAAVAALAEHGEAARVLAGGQSLMPMLNMRLAEPAVLIDIAGLAALDTIRVENGMLAVGATATQARLEAWPDLAATAPLLALVLPWVGHCQTRNRGTVCGSIVHADPSAELPLCLVALGGTVVLNSARGRRSVAAADFFTGVLSTVRRPDELVEAVRFPVHKPGIGYGFREISPRHGDFAIAAVAAIADDRRLRIAVGGVADRPVARDWPVLSGTALDDALNALAWDLDAAEDAHASAAYRRRLVRRIGHAVAVEACACRH